MRRISPQQIIRDADSDIEYTVQHVFSTQEDQFICSATVQRAGSKKVVVLKGSTKRKTYMEGVHNSIVQKLNAKHVVHMLDRFTIEPIHIIVLEYCDGGDLFDALIHWGNGSPFHEDDYVLVAVLVAVAVLSVLHNLSSITPHNQNKWVHRDIKPENLLLRRKVNHPSNLKLNDIALCDFEFLAMDGFVTRTAGTDMFMPPESFDDPFTRNHARLETHTTTAIDVWALGVVLIDILDHESTRQYTAQSRGAPLSNKAKSILRHYSDDKPFSKTAHELARFLSKMVRIDPARRPSVQNLQTIVVQYHMEALERNNFVPAITLE